MIEEEHKIFMKMAFKIILLPYSKLFYTSLRGPKRKSEVQSASSKIVTTFNLST